MSVIAKSNAVRTYPLSLLILSALLASCSMMPDYRRPDSPVPTQWAATPAKVGADETALLADWRNYFTDPYLQSLIATALEHNRDLKIAVGRVAEARAQAGVAQADRWPSVDLNAQRNAALIPADLSSNGRALGSQRYDINLGIGNFELDFWGRVKSLDEAARANLLAADYTRRALRMYLIAEVANAYLSRLELDERLSLAQATVNSREETRFLISRRRDSGLAADLDLLQADGALQLARAEVANLARSQAAAENALRLLVGSTPSAAPAERRLAQQGIVADLAVGLPADMLLNRPDVLSAEHKLIAANANIGAARAAFLPKIVLTATLGTASHGLSALFGAGNGVWSFIPALRLPLFDHGKNAANEDLAEARKHIAVADYEKTIQAAFREVADLLSARQQLALQLRAQQAHLDSQGQRLKIVEARYRAGVSSHLELLDAQRDSFNAQQTLVAIQRLYLSTAVSLYKSLGAGDIAAGAGSPAG